MDDLLKISIAVPAYNEEKRIEATVENILKAKLIANNIPIEVILINDGSIDQTPQICDSLAAQYDFIQVIHHSTNKGLGESIRNSIKIAKGEKWAVLPGDNDTPRGAIVTLFENHNKADMVMLYFLNREMRGIRRNTMSIIFNTIYLIVFRIFVQYLNGPGTFSTKVLQEMDIFSSRFSIIAEIRVKLLRQGYSFHELPSYMNTGAAESSALSLKNLKEVILTFFHLIYDVYFVEKEKYSKFPKRIM